MLPVNCLRCCLIAILGIVVRSVIAEDPIWVAEGLTIRQVADDDLVPDCTAVTTDTAGRIVASGPGYIRVLLNANDDGVFENSWTLVDGLEPRCAGIVFS